MMRVKILLMLFLLALGLSGCALLGGDAVQPDPGATATSIPGEDAYPGLAEDSPAQPKPEDGEIGMPVDGIGAAPIDSGAAATPEPAPDPAEDPTDDVEPSPAEPEPEAVQYPFGTQIGSPVAAMNFAHPEAGCQWQGVAGQVFDLDGNPASGYVVELGGYLDGQYVFGLALSGLAPAYGPGGYEIVLGNQPRGSQREIWIRLLDVQGNQLSPLIYIDTYVDCGRNLVLLNFAQGAALVTNEIYLPAVKNDGGQE